MNGRVLTPSDRRGHAAVDNDVPNAVVPLRHIANMSDNVAALCRKPPSGKMSCRHRCIFRLRRSKHSIEILWSRDNYEQFSSA